MRESVIHRLLLPAAVGLIAVIFALNVMERLLMQQQAQVEAATKAQAVFVKNKIESVLQARTLPLELLGRRWEIRGEINDIDMESDAALVMSGLPAYQSLEWVDPTFHVRWASRKPPADAPSGAALVYDSARTAALKSVAATGRMTVSGPLNLPDGSRGFLVCVPFRPELIPPDL
jgi:sensor domain CHASE-containing protein